METISIAGLDRISAHELEEIFEANGQAENLSLHSGPQSSGRAGALELLTAEIAGRSSDIILLLTVWIATKKTFTIDLTRENGRGEKKSLKLSYNQEGAAGVLKALRDFFANG